MALRKTRDLLAAGARVRVVSPRLRAEFQPLVRAERVVWIRRAFRSADLRGVWLVVSATDDGRVNRAAAREAGRRRIWANVVDQPTLCSFIVPSVVRRGKLRLAISTGGASPALAQWIRKDLERRYGPEWRHLLTGMGRARQDVKRKVPSAQRKALFEKALRAYLQVLGIR